VSDCAIIVLHPALPHSESGASAFLDLSASFSATSTCHSQLRSSMFYFIDIFPPKESMKEFVENRGRRDENGPKTIIAGIS
jgi:hypothetical protein